MRLVKRIGNLGYGSRKEVTAMLRSGRITDADGEVLYADDRPEHDGIRIDGEPLDPPPGLCLMLHKPVGVTCSNRDVGRLVFDLLPPRFRLRSPLLSCVGRLDKDTSGLLLLTDDGALLHRIVSPKAGLRKFYEATLAEPLRGDEARIFESGELMLEGESLPLRPVRMTVHAEQQATLELSEGRYHQVRRMFAAVGNHVAALHRPAIGGLTLGDLPEGQWRVLDSDDLDRLFADSKAEG